VLALQSIWPRLKSIALEQMDRCSAGNGGRGITRSACCSAPNTLSAIAGGWTIEGRRRAGPAHASTTPHQSTSRWHGGHFCQAARPISGVWGRGSLWDPGCPAAQLGGGGVGGRNRPQPWFAGWSGDRGGGSPPSRLHQLVGQGRLAHIRADRQGDEARAEASERYSIMPGPGGIWVFATLNVTLPVTFDVSSPRVPHAKVPDFAEQ